MPLSFRRSYKKLPTADLDRNKRRVSRTPRKKTAVEVPAEFRPRRYPAMIPIGCGLVAGLCLFIVISQGYMHLPSVPGAASLEATAAATLETGTTPIGEFQHSAGYTGHHHIRPDADANHDACINGSRVARKSLGLRRPRRRLHSGRPAADRARRRGAGWRYDQGASGQRRSRLFGSLSGTCGSGAT